MNKKVVGTADSPMDIVETIARAAHDAVERVSLFDTSAASGRFALKAMTIRYAPSARDGKGRVFTKTTLTAELQAGYVVGPRPEKTF